MGKESTGKIGKWKQYIVACDYAEDNILGRTCAAPLRRWSRMAQWSNSPFADSRAETHAVIELFRFIFSRCAQQELGREENILIKFLTNLGELWLMMPNNRRGWQVGLFLR